MYIDSAAIFGQLLFHTIFAGYGVKHTAEADATSVKKRTGKGKL